MSYLNVNLGWDWRYDLKSLLQVSHWLDARLRDKIRQNQFVNTNCPWIYSRVSFIRRYVVLNFWALFGPNSTAYKNKNVKLHLRIHNLPPGCSRWCPSFCFWNNLQILGSLAALCSQSGSPWKGNILNLQFHLGNIFLRCPFPLHKKRHHSCDDTTL